MTNYEFDPSKAYAAIRDQWTAWANAVGAKRFVFGVSGGKDSTVIAVLAARIFGAENCYGVMMPNDKQADIEDSVTVINSTGIKCCYCNIEDVYGTARKMVENAVKGPISSTARINLAPRLRMATLYAVAQTVGGFVINTDNLSERVLGWSTLWGDSVGDFAPIQELTKTEVVKLGEWLGIPDALIHKVPSDGLCGQSDEEKMGISYADLDDLIRAPVGNFNKVFGGLQGDFASETDTIIGYYRRSQYKRDAIHLPGVKFDLPFNLNENLKWKENYKENN